MGNLDFSINLSCMSLTCGQKPEYPERTHANTGRTCKLHANAPIDGDQSEKELHFGNISPRLRRNADPCTYTHCKWPGGHYIIVPFKISASYTSAEHESITRGLLSFHESTCIRFVPKTLNDMDYLYFFSGDRCSSKVGRRGGKQEISLKKSRCLNISTVQHEVLHALGFRHEHSRSDRDKHVYIHTENIKPGHKHNFKKVQTNNLGTTYDFKSVMQYTKHAFSRNRSPTILARSSHKLDFGDAKQMSANDIARVNRLYKCSK
ncbi:low choriolytic enzyme isoform X1 [Oreochromis niloticus]|uniref:low choriolytic enzyme isoform X1 n=1 Tax=Oreochromis niloticus TaxID=8128 RepID=UPI000DF11980|nr:low choriolytic enzyme isoform X1 [Oreochromis niloticus]